MIRQPVSIFLEATPTTNRFFHGFVKSITHKGEGSGDAATAFAYDMEVVPHLWFLKLTQDCRVFQEQTVEEIVGTVLKESGVKHFRFVLHSEYQPHRYCVQYRESNFDFISRLLEEEGIYYYFEHSNDRHVLVMSDSPVSPKLALHPVSFYSPRLGTRESQTIKSIEFRSQAVTSKVVLRDFDFKKPARPLEESRDAEDGWGERLEYPGDFFEERDGRRVARIRLEEAQAGHVVGSGTGENRMFCPGFRFGLVGFADKAADKEYLLVSVQHTAKDNHYRSGATNEYRYENQFQAIPHEVRYRPPRDTPKPVVPGSQSAVVVGPSGEEVYTDEFGRVKIQFHWDRRGGFNAKSSCWVRVSQPWAGKKWGAISLPRIGQEVLVDFLEGDPDRPVISGRFYNADHMPPFDLPEGKVNMGFKSKSIFGGGFNEISINDTNTTEGVRIHAQYDMSTKILHDDTISVGNDRTEDVANNEDVTIGNNQSLTVNANRTKKVAANEDITVGANRSSSIGSNETHTVSVTRTHSVGVNEMINVGAAQEVTVGGIQLVTVGISQVVTVGMKQIVTAGSEISLSAKKIVLNASEEVTLSCGGGVISIDAGGNITIRGPQVKINS